MPVRRAIANGNWSNAATWFGGGIPANGDTVVASGFNVVCDVDITIGGANNPLVNAGSFVNGQWYQIEEVGTTTFTTGGAASNSVGVIFQYNGNAGTNSGTGVAKALATIQTGAIAAASAAAGGGFTITTARAFSADVRAGTTTCLTVTGTSNVTWTGTIFNGGSASGAFAVLNNATAGTISISFATLFPIGAGTHAINNASTGSVSVTSSSIFGGGGSNGILNASTGSVSVSSSILTAGSSGAAALNASTGSISISASTINGGSGSGAFGVNNASTGSVSISASTINGGSNSSAAGANNNSTGSFSITSSTLNASSVVSAFTGVNVSAAVSLQGSQYDHPNGTVAVYCPKYKIGEAPSLMQYRKALDGASTFVDLYTADFGVFGNPATNNVRSGIAFGGGSLIGTAAIPSPSSVAYGVAVDATTGTAVLTPSAVQAALLPLL